MITLQWFQPALRAQFPSRGGTVSYLTPGTWKSTLNCPNNDHSVVKEFCCLIIIKFLGLGVSYSRLRALALADDNEKHSETQGVLKNSKVLPCCIHLRASEDQGWKTMPWKEAQEEHWKTFWPAHHFHKGTGIKVLSQMIDDLSCYFEERKGTSAWALKIV